jgi:hypothetical protein
MSELTGGVTTAPRLRIAQAPFTDGDPWIAVGWTNPRSNAAATGRLSVLFHAPAGLDPSRPLGGFLNDAWVDTLPAANQDTALALRFNGPDTRPPQTVLLAVASDTARPTWTTDLMVATLRDTLHTTLLRLGGYASFLSMAHLGESADGSGVTFTHLQVSPIP